MKVDVGQIGMVCAVCGCRIKPGQLYIAKPIARHVACPTMREIAHAKRMGRL